MYIRFSRVYIHIKIKFKTEGLKEVEPMQWLTYFDECGGFGPKTLLEICIFCQHYKCSLVINIE